MSCQNNDIGVFINKYKNKKRVPFDDVIRILYTAIEDCKANLHIAPCGWGDDVPQLSPEKAKENEVLKKQHSDILEKLERIKYYLRD